MTFKPYDSYVLVRRFEESTQQEEGIYQTPDSAKEKPQEGIVLAIGKNCEEVAVNDHVLFGRFAGKKQVINNEELLIMQESELMGHLVDD